MKPASAIKTKKCRICANPFPLFRSTQQVCSPECAQKHAENVRVKRERQEMMERKEAIKPLSHWLKLAQVAMNRWVREVRDRDVPCISCGRTAISYDAGHYRSVGAASHLRFNEDNLHKQCSRPCNHDLSGNIVEYRIGLIKKIGIERVESLETNSSTRKWTIEEAQEIKRKYSELWRKARANEKA